MTMSSLLLVTAGARAVALPLDPVVEVVPLDDVFPVPAVDPTLRGVAPWRGRLVPVFHLGALLEGRDCPAARSGTGVMATVGGRTVCLEVDEAADVVRVAVDGGGRDDGLPWTSGLARHGESLVPVLDLEGMRSRVLAAESTT